MLLEEMTTGQWLDHMAVQWKQGQHLTIMGETGTGKTDLSVKLEDLRGYVAILAVKRHDDTLQAFRAKGYKVIEKWPPRYDQHRVILWPKPRSLSDLPRQRVIIMGALQQMFTAGGWTIDADDLSYIFKYLRIKEEIGVLLNQGRSSRLTVVSKVTRPVGVLRDDFVQATYHVAFPYKDERDIATIGQITGERRRDMLYWNQQLDSHDFLAFDRVRRDVVLVRNTR